MNTKKLKHNFYLLLFAGTVALVGSPSYGAESSTKDGNVGAGGLLWTSSCVHCHNLREPNELRDDQWVTSVLHMRIRAGLTGQETRDVIAFIQASNATAAAERARRDLEAARAAQQAQSQDD